MKPTLQTIMSWVLFLCLLVAVQTAYSQAGFDVTKHVADPRSKVFSDGKNTVQNYIQYQLEQKTNCCGMDDMYIEIKYDKNGVVTSTRVMSSSNDCNKKAVPDIVKYIRWKVDDPSAIRPVYLGMRPSIACEGTDADNQYEPIAAPAGFDAGEYAANNTAEESDASKTADDGFDDGSADDNVDASYDPTADAEATTTSDEEMADAAEEVEEERMEEQPMADNTTPEPSAPAEPAEPAEPATTQPAAPESESTSNDGWGDPNDDSAYSEPATTQPANDQPVASNQQPGSDVDKGGDQNGVSEATGQPDSSGLEVYEYQPPTDYKARNLKPNEDHIGSTMNTSGPRSSVGFGLSQTKTALFVKKEMRKQGICGLAHVLVELRMEKDGNVTGVRYLKFNNEQVRDATRAILKDMKFSGMSSHRIYPLFEFKTYIDCTGTGQKGKVDEVPDYFYAPGEGGQRPAGAGTQPEPKEDPNNVTLPTDE